MTRTLGFADLFFYAASVALSIRWISVAAAAGPASLPLWLVAVLVFSVPLTMATAELTGRFAGEGGAEPRAGIERAQRGERQPRDRIALLAEQHVGPVALAGRIEIVERGLAQAVHHLRQPGQRDER